MINFYYNIMLLLQFVLFFLYCFIIIVLTEVTKKKRKQPVENVISEKKLKNKNVKVLPEKVAEPVKNKTRDEYLADINILQKSAEKKGIEHKKTQVVLKNIKMGKEQASKKNTTLSEEQVRKRAQLASIKVKSGDRGRVSICCLEDNGKPGYFCNTCKKCKMIEAKWEAKNTTSVQKSSEGKSYHKNEVM